jgi:predicted component of type VI protein secretion system
VVRVDGQAPREAVAVEGSVLIGRGTVCAIMIGDEAISRVHAKLDWSDGGWWIRDASSRNGTQLNGEPVPPDRRVQVGDSIDLVGDVAHRIEILALDAANERPTKTLAALKSLVLARKSSLVHIETANGKRIEAPISPRSGQLLALLIEARLAGTALRADLERRVAGGADKNAAEAARRRLRAWWVDLCAEHPELDAASPRALDRKNSREPEILLVIGDERRLAISVASLRVD